MLSSRDDLLLPPAIYSNTLTTAALAIAVSIRQSSILATPFSEL